MHVVLVNLPDLRLDVCHISGIRTMDGSTMDARWWPGTGN